MRPAVRIVCSFRCQDTGNCRQIAGSRARTGFSPGKSGVNHKHATRHAQKSRYFGTPTLYDQCAIDAVSEGGDARIGSPVGKDWPGLVRAWRKNSAIISTLPSA